MFLTMMGSVSERTTEIGVFRAIGFRREQITRLVLLEAVAAGVAAGVLGYAAGMAVSYAVLPFVARGGAGVVDAAARPRPPSRPPWPWPPSPPCTRRSAPARWTLPRPSVRSDARASRGVSMTVVMREISETPSSARRSAAPAAPEPREQPAAAGRRARRALHRGARPGEDVRGRRRAGARAARPRPRGARGDVSRRDGAVGLGQEHVPLHPRRAQPPERRQHLRGRHRPVRAGRREARRLPPRVPRLRLPELQPGAVPDGAGERHAAAGGEEDAVGREARPRARGAAARGARRPRRAPARQALGRRAGARGHRARARQRAAAHPRRRAHRRARHARRRSRSWTSSPSCTPRATRS